MCELRKVSNKVPTGFRLRKAENVEKSAKVH